MRKITPPPFSLEVVQKDIPEILKSGEISPVNEKGEYIHWDKLRYRSPPDGLTAEQYWQRLKFARMMRIRGLPFYDTRGNKFWFCQTEQLAKFQHWLDKKAAGQLGADNPDAFGAKDRERFLMNGLFDEAIYSSQLEGSTTTRDVARDILAKPNRRPANKDEEMIVNNHRAMEFIQQQKHAELSIPMILELHRLLTAKTLDNKLDEGMLRQRDDIFVRDNLDGKTMHTPPPAAELLPRLQLLCDFANEKEPDLSLPPLERKMMGEFLHPVLRAIILHFMLAYEHPFVDGNGRTARALFYWAMARDGYWLMPYASISGVIKNARREYDRAFVCAETDGNDMTYFLLHQAKTIRAAFAYFDKHVQEQRNLSHKMKKWEQRVLQSGRFNRRQTALLNYALKHPQANITINGHRARHHVSYPSAHADIRALANVGLFLAHKVGKEYLYQPCEDLPAQLGVGQ